jgi:hypothetical protein
LDRQLAALALNLVSGVLVPKIMASATRMHETKAAANSLPCWQIGDDVCALADCERHLGHILRAESQWIAFDGTCLGENGVGFRLIGVFPDMESAKTAVELATIFMAQTRGAAAGLN